MMIESESRHKLVDFFLMVPVDKLTDVRLECIKNPAFIAKTNKLERLHNLNTKTNLLT